MPIVRLGNLVLGAVLAALGAQARADDAGWIPLNRLSDWKSPTGAWVTARAVKISPVDARRLAYEPGEGLLVNGPSGRTDNLVSKQSFGDIETHVEFFIPKRSNSGVKFEGLYEIQIFDSHGVKTPTASDCGGIYPRAEMLPTYHHIDQGHPPRVNAARPAGEWQTLDVIFQAPRFDPTGRKIANARMIKVVLNGTTIHENVDLQTPTGHAWHDKEVPTGPLLLQADHGPVAFRNIKVRPWHEAGR